MTWLPALALTPLSQQIKVGDVVAYNYRAWEVTHIRPGDETTAVTLRRLYGDKHPMENSAQDIGLSISARWNPFPVYEDGRVPLCSCHSHPWPCREAEQQRAVRSAMRSTERELQLLPGCCPACQEPITRRQRTITFPGAYVRNPLGPSNPTFHLRSKCWQGAADYEELWVAAYPDTATRSLLTLQCNGILEVHRGGVECDAADCPSVYAGHRGQTICQRWGNGCPACDPITGCRTRLADRPKDPRDIPQPPPPTHGAIWTEED